MATAYSQVRSIDPDFETQLMDSIDKWIERDLRPVVMHHDHNDIWPAETVQQMVDLGLFGATIGEDYGGLGLPSTTYAKIVARVSSYWMAPTGIFNSHLICAHAIEKFGTPEQKQTWLPKMASGAHRAGRRHRFAGHPHDGTQDRQQRLQHQWHQDLDFQRHQGLGLCPAGENRSRCPAALQRHESVHRRQARRLQGWQEDREAGLQGD
jgi:hypothetical protein